MKYEVYGILTGRVYVSGISHEMAEQWISRQGMTVADFLRIRPVR